MTTEGREMRKLAGEMVRALERSAQANEDLLALAKQEQIVTMEVGPPVCPYCGKVNPEVTQIEGDGSGPLGSFVMAAETHCCNKTIYAVPIGMDTFMTKETADEMLRQKGG